MKTSSRRALLALLAAASLAIGAAYAQAPTITPPPKPNPIDANPVQAQQQRQLTQPLNNRPVWSEVRSGAPGYTSIPGRETNVLIQSQGQTWRAARVPIVFWGGLLFAFALAGLALVHALRGTIETAHPAGERVIERFSPADRYAHWLMAITWVTMAITGLVMSLGKSVLLPLIGYTLFSWLALLSKYLHNFVGPILIVAAPWLIVRFIRDNGISGRDIAWLANLKGFFTDSETPSGRFNGGEKIVFWLLLVLATPVLIISGLVLLFPNFDQTRVTMQIANGVHMIVAYLAFALAAVHIYIGTLGVAGAYRAMRDGYVDESWALHHHKLWYEDVVAGRARQHFVDPDEAARVAVSPRPRVA